MDKLLIVDGSNLLFQMFYGMPARIIGRHGKPIQGTLGFVGALLKIIRAHRPTHAVVLFDGECENPRKELDEAYKANRPDYSYVPEEETPFSQLPDIYAALDVLGIRYAETQSCEADDWIAGYARCYGDRMHIVICSQDSDFFQLITDNVHVLRYRGENSVLCDRNSIMAKLGVTPQQYASYKALTGDTADNIRGVDKIGPKTAAQLLNQFGTLEAMIALAEQIHKPSIRQAVKEHTDRIRHNLGLIELQGAQQLPYSVDALTYSHEGYTTMQVLQRIGIK